jgi:acyl transferase domain-containing protein
LNDSIAIVGMSCRFPGANSIDEFWKLLEAGHEGICRVPNDRWTKDNSLVRLDDVRDIRKTEAGFLTCPIDKFDAKFFNTNAADLACMDPQQRLGLQIVWDVTTTWHSE